MFTLAEIVDLALRIEENGQRFYRQAMDSVTEPRTKTLLAWMADEEERHARWFADLRRPPQITDGNPFFEEMTREVLQDLLGRRTFSLDEVDASALASSDQVLAAALEFERDTVLFYEILAGFVTDPAVAAQLKAIIAEENEHIRQLQAIQGPAA